jgi:hypothetical protein
MYRCGDVARNMVIGTFSFSVMWITDANAGEPFSPNLLRSLSDTLAKTLLPEMRSLDASGALDVRSVIRTPLERLNARLNVRLRRLTTVLTAHDHTEFGTDMLCIIADALSLSVRHGRFALPSMWWVYGAEYCTSTPNRPHI